MHQQLTSTWMASPSVEPPMCPSGKRPLGKRDSSTNSGSVSSSSRERTNRVPLVLHVSLDVLTRPQTARAGLNVPKVHGYSLIGADIFRSSRQWL